MEELGPELLSNQSDKRFSEQGGWSTYCETSLNNRLSIIPARQAGRPNVVHALHYE